MEPAGPIVITRETATGRRPSHRAAGAVVELRDGIVAFSLRVGVRGRSFLSGGEAVVCRGPTGGAPWATGAGGRTLALRSGLALSGAD